MKIVFLTSNFPPETFAGTEMVAATLARSLRRDGHEVVVAASSSRSYFGDERHDEEWEGTRVHRFYKHVDEWDTQGHRRPRLLTLWCELLRRERPDAVHVHSMASWGTGCVEVARDLGIRTVLSFHDVWVTCPRYFRLPPEGSGIVCPTGAGRGPCAPCVNLSLHSPDLATVVAAIGARDAAVRAEVALADALTAPSRTAARLVRQHLPTDRSITVIPHGVIHPVPADEFGTPPAPGDTLRVGTFGNLVREKGIVELVDAVAGLPCELHLHGPFFDPELQAKLHERAREQGTTLIWHGGYRIGDPHPTRHLHLAVFPSRCQETYGLVVDEALAHGVPVVVSDQGALQERGELPGVVVSTLPSLPTTLHDLVTRRDRLLALWQAVPRTLPCIDDAAAAYLDLYSGAVPA
ncbi:MAG: glycosyltransferase [Planctomycetes bacterium]|nr:glycosyltransferase [Planctomycetota bacterium]